MGKPDSTPKTNSEAPVISPGVQPAEPVELVPQPEQQTKTQNLPRRLIGWYKSHKRLSVPATILILVLICLSIPFSRYGLLGLVMKKNYMIQVIDSETKSPVSGATVSLGSISSQTNADGKAVLKTKVGKHTFMIGKKYYLNGQIAETVPIFNEKNVPSIKLVATGRQVKISVKNIISKQPVADVTIKVADITAQTNSSGNAMVVLPPGVPHQKATLSANGYNNASVVVDVSDNTIAQNNLTITPAGKVYFLSKRTGIINLMKSNLDGTDQTVVIAGTGKEDDTDTILLASRNWKYLAFKAKRDDGPAKLYYIDTSVDKLNTLDEGNATFTMIGWSGDNFIYQVDRNGVADGQPGRQALKSFNAQTGKLTVINQTSGAIGTGYNSGAYANENYGSEYIIGDSVVFDKYWTANFYIPNSPIVGKQAGVYSVSSDGSNFKTLKTFSYDASGNNVSSPSLSSVLYEPQEIYYSEYSAGNTAYYKYQNGAVTGDSTIADAYNGFISEPYPTYLESPSGDKTFWTEQRDGQSVFLVGDQYGGNSKVVARLSTDYKNYGWFSDNYLLVSKNSSELYIMPVSGVKNESGLIKITDYHKPAYNFYGYGGGYGGL